MRKASKPGVPEEVLVFDRDYGMDQRFRNVVEAHQPPLLALAREVRDQLRLEIEELSARCGPATKRCALILPSANSSTPGSPPAYESRPGKISTAFGRTLYHPTVFPRESNIPRGAIGPPLPRIVSGVADRHRARRAKNVDASRERSGGEALG